MTAFRTLQQEAREFLEFRWKPSRDLAVVVLSYAGLVGVLYTAFQIVTAAQVALNFILYGAVGLLALGVVLPVLYNTVARGRPLAELGITRKYLVPSLALGAILGFITYLGTLATVALPGLTELLPLAVMAVTVGLFEAVFFRGWIQLRLDRAFGAIPAIVLGAASYAFYHIGYGMTLGEIGVLFLLGLSFALAFRVTRNVLVLWPFYTWIGGLYTTLNEGLRLPFESIYGFVNVLAWMGIAVGMTYWWRRKKRASRREGAPAANA